MRSTTVVFGLLSLLMSGCGIQAPQSVKQHAQTPTGKVRGVYVRLGTLHNDAKLAHLIHQAHSHHINTFVVDLKTMPSPRYKRAIQHILRQKIAYVPRVVLFPGGGTYAQIHDPSLWQKPWPMVQEAIELGAHAIQLDYIRYRTDTAHHTENRHDIHRIVKWYANQVHAKNTRLQLAIFGVTAFAPVHTIGQDAALLAKDADTICPMVYPSHFEPYKTHAKTPFKTIKRSMQSFQTQLTKANKLIPYLEPYNYRVQMNASERVDYTAEQIRGAQASHVDGWYFWSANNIYKHLFMALDIIDNEST
jgi:hypothetical protein